MKLETFEYVYGNEIYNVFLTLGKSRNINYRIKKDGFHISAPYLVTRKRIMDGLDKFAPKLIKNFKNSTSHFSFEDDYVFVLGNKMSLKQLEINNIDELEVFLKRQALEVLTTLVRKYEKVMGISKPYKVGIRKTSTRFGSNSLCTHSLSFQRDLIHFSEEIISTVVVHELAHEFHRNHQQGFYNCVYSYCPDYDALQKKLKKGIHQWFIKLHQDKTIRLKN